MCRWWQRGFVIVALGCFSDRLAIASDVWVDQIRETPVVGQPASPWRTRTSVIRSDDVPSTANRHGPAFASGVQAKALLPQGRIHATANLVGERYGPALMLRSDPGQTTGPVQVGWDNVAVLTQSSSPESDVSIVQRGSYQLGSAVQLGLSNVTSLQQTGTNNFASVVQAGSANVMSATQSGSGNRLVASQH